MAAAMLLGALHHHGVPARGDEHGSLQATAAATPKPVPPQCPICRAADDQMPPIKSPGFSGKLDRGPENVTLEGIGVFSAPTRLGRPGRAPPPALA